MTLRARRGETSRRVVLHPGAHKTGTSLVQKFLQNKADFRARNRIAYITRSDSGSMLRWGHGPAEDPSQLAGRLAKELAAHPDGTVVLSNENALGRPFLGRRLGLYPEAAQAAGGLRAATADLETRVVYYLRPIEDFVESYYLQTVHQGKSHDFADWFATIDPNSLSWQPVIDALDGSFGAANVAIGDFTEIKRGQDAFLRMFFRRAGLGCDGDMSFDAVANPSISARGLQIALDVNPLLNPDSNEHGVMRRFLQAHFSNRDFERAHPMPPEVREQLAAIDRGGVDDRLRHDAVVLDGSDG